MARKPVFDRHPRLADADDYVRVADARLHDASVLRDNARPTGAAYLAGLSIEIRLKAVLLKAYPHLNDSRPRWTAEEVELRELLLKRHDLIGLIDALPQLERALRDARSGGPSVRQLKRVAAGWDIGLRYDPEAARPRTVKDLIEAAQQLQEIIS